MRHFLLQNELNLESRVRGMWVGSWYLRLPRAVREVWSRLAVCFPQRPQQTRAIRLELLQETRTIRVLANIVSRVNSHCKHSSEYQNKNHLRIILNSDCINSQLV